MHVQGTRYRIRLTLELSLINSRIHSISFADLSSMRKHHAKKHAVSLVNSAVKSSADRAALDLAPHMVDGTPKCTHCLKVFPRPKGLREHIIAHCPVLHGSKASAAAAVSEPSACTTQGTPLGHPCRESPTEPVILRSSVRHALAGNSWRVLLKQPDLLAELKSFCVICGQWVAVGAGMQTHIRRCHPSAWKHKDAAVARTSQAGFLKGTPCHYYSLEIKQAGQHLKSCGVLFQAALADILIKDHGGNSSDACAIGDLPACQDQRTRHDNYGLGGTGGQERASRSKAGQTDKAPIQAKASGGRSKIRERIGRTRTRGRRQGGGADQHGAPVSQGGVETRRRTLPLENGVRLPGLLRYWGARRDEHLVQNGSGLEGKEGGGKGNHLLESDPLPQDSQDPAGQVGGAPCQ